MAHELLFSRMLGLLSVGVKITGGKRDIVLAAGDALHGRSWKSGLRDIAFIDSTLSIDASMPNERLLAYASRNIIRHYEESDLFRVMKRYVKSGGLFVDVGANLGIYSILANTRLSARTACFEPEPAHFAFLERNGAYFDEIHQTALSDVSGESTLHVGGRQNPGASSLVGDEATESGVYSRDVTVKLERFDAVMGGHESMDLVKIDVEGNEALTVRGMTGLFERGLTPPVWCEVRGPTSDRNPNSFRKVAETLASYGYRAYIGAGEEPFDLDSGVAPRVFDLLFAVDK